MILNLVVNIDDVMHVSMWFDFFGGFFNVKTYDIWKGHVTTMREI